MPRAEREYSRLYHDLVDDEMMAAIYPDDALFGAWAKLLMGADTAWPASAALPFGMSKARLKRLCDAELVTITGARYRVRGLDKEREKRANAGRKGAEGRWNKDPGPDAAGNDEQSGGDAIASASAMPSHSERNAAGMPSQDEPSQAEQRRDENTGRTPTPLLGGRPRLAGAGSRP